MKTSNASSISDRYFKLVRAFPLRRLRTDADLARANEMIDALLSQDERSRDEEDYLDVLADLVETYEDEAHPLPEITDADMLRHLIKSRRVTQAEVVDSTGIAKSTLSQILAGRRSLNRNHITALARFFSVSPAVFISTDVR
jgi:HTH-type transcriptional regulator/antitoxin HigA